MPTRAVSPMADDLHERSPTMSRRIFAASPPRAFTGTPHLPRRCGGVGRSPHTNGAYAEEMQGIADGSGQTEDTIALLNARYELAFTLFGQEARSERVAELAEVAPDGCT